MNRKYIYCDLSAQVIEVRDLSEAIAGKKAEAFSLALMLYEEYEGLHPIVVGSANLNTGLTGANLFSIVFHSPVANAVRYTYSNVSFGLSLALAGYDAIVITGHARKLSYLEVYPDGRVELKLCEQMRDSSPMRFYSVVGNSARSDVLAIGRTGEKKVLMSTLYYNGDMDVGCHGLGAVFGEANLKALAVTASGEREKDTKLDDECARRIKKTELLRRMKLYGNAYMLAYGNDYGFLPIDNYSLRTDPRVVFLTGKVAYEKKVCFADTCRGCRINCNSRSGDGVLLPRFEEIMALGLNLGFFNMEHIKLLVEAVREAGLNAVETGALLAYLKTLENPEYPLPSLHDAPVEEFVRVIGLIGEPHTVGEALAAGLKAFPEAIQMSDGTAVLCDLRGANIQSVFLSLSERSFCFPDLFYGLSYHGNPRSLAGLALYCELLTHKALNFSIPPELLCAMYFNRKYKLYLLRFRAGVKFMIRRLGLKQLTFLNESINRYRSLAGEEVRIPEYFIKNPGSNKDDRTVPYNALMFYYHYAKSKLESVLPESETSSALSR
jgi:Aldehyde:ferredoxin oxidoreductase